MYYTEAMYRESLKPETDYPGQLAQHIADVWVPNSAQDVLDFGCGRGEIAAHLGEMGYRVVGADHEVPPSALARSNRVEWLTVENHGEAIPDESFDFIMLKSVIEHQWHPVELLKQCRRMLRAGGSLLCLTPDWARNKTRFFDDHTHRTPFTRVSLHNAFLLAGFVSPSVDYFLQLPSTWQNRYLRTLSNTVGPLVPSKVNWKPLRWARERQLAGYATKE